MCGIGGLIYKTPNHRIKTGEAVVKMLERLYRRGPDSTGVVLHHPKDPGVLYVDVNYEREGNGEAIMSLLQKEGKLLEAHDRGEYVAARLEFDGDLQQLVQRIDGLAEDISVASIGNQLEVLKYTGGVENLEGQFHIADYDGPVALGHTRMATESKVDISHSQPLSARGIEDLTIIHNGHITNYLNLRGFFEYKGYTFSTSNDSEVIAVYLADKMAHGADLKQAMEQSLRDLDGSFTYLAMTAHAVGLAREPFGMKPMVIAETDDFVAFASEGAALCYGMGENLNVREPAAEEVLVWEL